MESKCITLKADISNLLARNIKPSSIVGTGYKNGRQVASQWLRKELHNKSNPSATVDQIIVMSSGQAFSSEAKAIQSKSHKLLVNGDFKVWKTHRITDFGVFPSEFGDGFEIYIQCSVIKGEKQ